MVHFISSSNLVNNLRGIDVIGDPFWIHVNQWVMISILTLGLILLMMVSVRLRRVSQCLDKVLEHLNAE